MNQLEQLASQQIISNLSKIDDIILKLLPNNEFSDNQKWTMHLEIKGLSEMSQCWLRAIETNVCNCNECED